MRYVLWHIFLAALPFMLYWGYQALVTRKLDAGGHWNDRTAIGLLAAGLVLAMASLFYLALSDSKPAGSVYTPLKFEDGKRIEGEISPPHSSPQQ